MSSVPDQMCSYFQVWGQQDSVWGAYKSPARGRALHHAPACIWLGRETIPNKESKKGGGDEKNNFKKQPHSKEYLVWVWHFTKTLNQLDV